MTSYFVDKESEKLFDFYPEWKQIQLMRFAKELGFKIQVSKTPCPQILYFFSEKYHPQNVNNPLLARDDYINIFMVSFIGKKPQSIFPQNVRYKQGVYKICPIMYKSQVLMLYFENIHNNILFFVEAEHKRVYATIFTIDRENGVTKMWIEFEGMIHEFYVLPPDVVQRLKNCVNELIDNTPLPRKDYSHWKRGNDSINRTKIC